MTWREDEREAGKFLAQFHICAEDDLLFARSRRSRNKNRPLARELLQLAAQGHFCRRVRIEFGIARDHDTPPLGAHLDEAFYVVRSLRHHQVGALDSAGEQAAEALVALNRALGNSSIDDRDF